MFLAGMLVGMAVLGLVIYINYKQLDVRWYEWLTGVLGFGLLLFTLQNVTAAASEYWEVAPLVFLWVFGVPALILLAASVIMPFFRHWRKKQASREEIQA